MGHARKQVKNIPKSPEKSSDEGDDEITCTQCGENLGRVLQAITALRTSTETQFKNIKEELSSIQSSLDSRLKVQEETVENLKGRVSTLEDELKTLKASNEKNAKQLLEFQNRVINNESHNRRLNLIFGNIPESDDENPRESVNKVLIENLKIPEEKVNGMLMRDVHRLGRTRNKDDSNANNALTKPRNLIAAFIVQEDRNLVYSKARNLKGSNITMRVDLTKEHAATRDQLMMKRRTILNFNQRAFVKISYRQYNHPIMLVKYENKVVEFEDKMQLEKLEIVNGRN